MDKHQIAQILQEMSLLYELKGENPFKIRAYQNAARALENLNEDLEQIILENRLREIEGIGEAMQSKILTLHETGTLLLYEELKAEIPEGLRSLLQIAGLGAKKVKTLYETLNIQSVEELKKACQEKKVQKLEHFGEKTEQNILQGIEHLEQYHKKDIWWKAWQVASFLLKEIKKLPQVKEAEIAGSIRRKLETIGDVDLLVASSDPKPVMDWFTKQSEITVTQKGETKSSIRLKNGMQVDLRVILPQEFVYALHYFTGSKQHNIKIRQIAHEQGHLLNEYGIFPIDSKTKPLFPKRKKVTEKDLFESLGLSYIPPEMREDLGEIEAAKKKQIPTLIEFEDIQGVFHCHTAESDGHNTLEEMVEGAQEFGWKYIGITDHSKSSVQANGLSEERLLDQIKKIEKLNQSKKYSIHVFAGTECDILIGGSLDFSDEILKQLDFVIASIHQPFKQDEKTITKRMIKAIEHPLTTMIAHPTGRLLLKREPYPIDMQKVIDAAIANQKIIELNTNPYRLDMDWRLWHRAIDKGLLCSINPDAHHVDHYLFIHAGINVAKKGWITKDHVFNTWPISKIKKYLKR